MLRFVHDREGGRAPPAQVRLAECTRRMFALDLGTARIVSPHRQAVVTLDIDPIQGRLYGREPARRRTTQWQADGNGVHGVRQRPSGRLLSGSAGGGIALFDLDDDARMVTHLHRCVPSSAHSRPCTLSQCLACYLPGRQANPRRTSGRRRGHKSAVTRVQWYQWDTGMFLSSSTDRTVKVWDVESLKPAISFPFDNQVRPYLSSPASLRV